MMEPHEKAFAFHGMALNRQRPLEERLQLALEALRRYEAVVRKLREELDT